MISKISKSIIVRTQFEAIHRWKDAPEEVFFLRNFHRHLFKLSIQISVDGLDRELEYFMVLNRLNEFLRNNFKKDQGIDASCETMGMLILDNFLLPTYGKNRKYKVEVSEDGENSGLLEYKPEALKCLHDVKFGGQ